MFEFPLGISLVVFLLVISFLSGIGITTIGPGGIFVTMALYSLTPLSSGEVAGTAHATFVATGLVGTAAYIRSGEMDVDGGRTLAILLSATSVLGALAGAYVNTYVPRPLFGALLGGTAVVVGGTILYREGHGLSPLYTLRVGTRSGTLAVSTLGFSLGVASGLLGIGGPVLAVPALVLIGVPMLQAVAVAQVQSIFIAGFAAAGYLSQGNVSFPLAVLVCVPLLAGVLVGWRIAHLVDPARLKAVLGVALVVLGAALVL